MLHSRYIRIEYLHRSTDGRDDTRYGAWKVGDKFHVSGPVKWDIDREGFLELHSTRAADVSVVKWRTRSSRERASLISVAPLLVRGLPRACQ